MKVLNGNYSILQEEIDEKKVGILPQCDGMSDNYNFNASDSVDNFANYKGRPCPFIPNLKGYKIHSKAILTDFLSGCPGPGEHLVISKKFYDIIGKYSIGSHQVFSTSIVHKKNVYNDYYTLHFHYSLEKDIRFEESLFTYAGKKTKEINSFSDYIRYRKERDPYGITKATVTHVDRAKFGKLDLFVIALYNQHVYISERLHNDIIDNKITGVRLAPADSLVLH